MPLTIGNTIHHGKYLINRVLGQTDLGVTFQGTQVQQNKPIVLQTLQLKPDLSLDLDQLKPRFFDQVHRFADCHHPGLAQLIDAFEEENAAIAVFDYTAGHTLLEVVHSTGALTESQAVQYIQQVGSALAELHSKGLIHRHITPKNVIRPMGSNIVVLVNIGLLDATVLGGAAQGIQLPVGEYGAIEQYQAELVHTPATDLYALAGTLYFLLTGYAPLAAPLRHRSPLPSPRQLCPHLSATVESAILCGLELNAHSRPQSIAEWLALLPLPISLSDRDSHLDAANSLSTPQATISGFSNPHPLLTASASLPTQQFSSQPNPSMTPSMLTLKNPFPKTLLATAAIAAAVGLGTGLTLRITANSTGPGTSIFHAEQAFPPFENWPGAAPLIPPSTPYSSPVVEAPNPRKEPDNPAQPPAVAEPYIEEEPSPKPVGEEVPPPPLSPQVPAPDPIPDAIAPPPAIPNTPEPELPPAVSPPPAPTEPQELAPPPAIGTPSSGEVQRQ